MQKYRKSTPALRLFGTIALLVSFTVNAADNSQAKGDDKKCVLKQIASIDLQGDLGNLVPVKIGTESFLMVLDTARFGSAMLEPAVARSKWKTRGIDTNATIAGYRITKAVDLEGIEIGSVRYTRVSFLVYPLSVEMSKSGGTDIIGILGMDVFQNVDFELDIAHRKLKMFSPNECAGSVVYWTDNYSSSPIRKGRYGDVYFEIELDGKKLEAVFDSQNPSSVLHTDVSKKLYGFDEKSTGNEVVPQADGNKAYYYRAMKMTAPGLSITNERIQLIEPLKTCYVTVPLGKKGAAGYDRCEGVHPLNLGLPVLTKLRIYYAMKDKVIYYSNADATR